MTGASVGIMPGQGWRAFGSRLEADPDASGQTTSISEFATIFITPEYFRLTGMSLIAGRLPDSLTWPRADSANAPSTPAELVVSRAFARRFWPDRNPIGARLREIRTGPFVRAGRSDVYTVVGVADDVRLPGGRDAKWTLELYGPMPTQIPELPVLLRSALPEREIVPAVRRVVADFDGTMRAEGARPIGALLREMTVGDVYLRESLAPARFAMALLVAFSILALVLSGVGLYGVIAYSVTQRTREIGVRVALGADAASVKRLVAGGGMKLTAFGIVLGITAAAASTRLLAYLLYGVSPADPVSFGVISLLVAAIAFAACYVPARRAVRIAPTEALRAD